MSQRDSTKLDVQVFIYELQPELERSKLVQVHTLDGKTELEPAVDRDIDAFAEYYAKTLNNGSLSGFERAAIKTYLYWKTHPPVK